MRSLAGLSVEFVAAMLRPQFDKLTEANLEFADSPRKPEDSLSQSLSSVCLVRGLPAWFIAAFIASCLALPAPLVFAQESEPSSAPATNNTTASKATSSTPAQPPAAGSGNGVTAELRLAQQQGKADTALLDWVLANPGQLKGDTRTGEMRIAFTISAAEGWWDKAGEGKLAWHEAPDSSVHLRIFVLDLADGRLLPGLNLRATLTDKNGNEQSVPVDFGWYPLINAYGGNLPLDTDSDYTLRVTVDVPGKGALPAPRQGVSVGEHFQHTNVAEFPPVPIVLEAVSQLGLASATMFPAEAELLKPCNAALSAAITALWQQSVSGAEKPVGDYFVGYALDYSGRAMHIAGSKLRLKNPIEFSGKDNVRLAVLPRDSRTGRLIPGLKLSASLIASDGKLYGPGDLPLSWHPWLNHYEGDTRIPRKGFYKLRIHFDAPGFRRWGRESERFAAAADVEFDDVSLQPGAKD